MYKIKESIQVKQSSIKREENLSENLDQQNLHHNNQSTSELPSTECCSGRSLVEDDESSEEEYAPDVHYHQNELI